MLACARAYMPGHGRVYAQVDLIPEAEREAKLAKLKAGLQKV